MQHTTLTLQGTVVVVVLHSVLGMGLTQALRTTDFSAFLHQGVWKQNLSGSGSVVQQGQTEQTDSVSSLTADRKASGYHFYLWTRNNPENDAREELDPMNSDSILNSNFQAHTTYVITHGFLGWGLEPWILHLKNKLLRVSDCNVVSVSWPAGTEWMPLSYYVAVGRVPVVAKKLSALIHSLSTLHDLQPADVHLLGHSLGAHVSGLAAKPFRGALGRITGLDPAGLTFHKTAAQHRLDASDAVYVDVIHTNGCKTWNVWGDCYGINENLGHSDFWPNGGEHQPACHPEGELEGEIGCDHEMSYKYYLESLDYGINFTFFLARNCSDWHHYAIGNCSCGSDTQYMGYYVNTRMSGIFYLNVNSSAPYAVADVECPPGSARGMWVRLLVLGLGVGFCIGILLAIISSTVLYLRHQHMRTREKGLLSDSDVAESEDCQQEQEEEEEEVDYSAIIPEP